MGVARRCAMVSVVVKHASAGLLKVYLTCLHGSFFVWFDSFLLACPYCWDFCFAILSRVFGLFSSVWPLVLSRIFDPLFLWFTRTNTFVGMPASVLSPFNPPYHCCALSQVPMRVVVLCFALAFCLFVIVFSVKCPPCSHLLTWLVWEYGLCLLGGRTHG